MDGFSRSSEKFITVAVVVVLAALLLGIGAAVLAKRGMPAIDPNAYQVVILDNNQQYFGHLKNPGRRSASLADIYYIRLKEPAAENGEQQFTLVKFAIGNEIHGPEDMMYLNWKHVVYWENLRPESEVVKGIYKEKAQRASGQAAAPAPTPSQPANLPAAPKK